MPPAPPVRYRYGDKFYGEGGIFWTYKSNEYNSNEDQITFNTEISGIRIPAMIGYYLLKEEATLIGLRAFGGASVLIVTTVNAFELTKDDFNKASWGVFLGAGVDISMFFVDLKYEWSLTDVSSVSSFDVGKSRSIFIDAGVKIGLKKEKRLSFYFIETHFGAFFISLLLSIPIAP